VKKYSTGKNSAALDRIRSEGGATLKALENTPATQELTYQLLHASIAHSTWSKYRSGWKAFEDFEQHTKKKFTWPLEKDTIRGFAVYCLHIRKIQPQSVRTYLASITMLHKLKGYTDFTISDTMMAMILRGAGNLVLASPTQPHNSRRVMSLPLLRHFGHKLAMANWHSMTTQCMWTAGLLAFFGTIRMGELLSGSESTFDESTTLTWGDVLYREEDDSFLLHLKIPKSAVREGEFVDIFPFKKFGCCPVAALKEHHKIQTAAGRGRWQDPVFIFPNGKMMTKSCLNQALKTLMQDVCDFTVNSLSCHSFRAGVPSELERHPDMMSSDDIKGWGRWNSEAYEKYTRLKLDQKKKIFKKITDILV